MNDSAQEVLKKFAEDMAKIWEDVFVPIIEDLKEVIDEIVRLYYSESCSVSGRNKPPNKYKDIPLHRRGKDNVYVTQRCYEKIRRGFPYWRRPY